jgi:tRNA(Glu) U13 pseudouridine synthase TruD
VEEEGGRERVIRVWHRRGSRDRRNSQWPGGKNKYCRFTLYKENRDAVDVVNYLARQLGVKSSVFQSAGLKDRRAITTQYYTAFKWGYRRYYSNSSIYSHCKCTHVG